VPETGRTFTADDARKIGKEIGIRWATAPFDVEQFRTGMNVELEHGLHDVRTNVSKRLPALRSWRTRPDSPRGGPRRVRQACRAAHHARQS
jgi:hypothetical protein